METIVTAGEAADALRINQIHQVQTGQAVWISGGSVTPGSSSTQLTVSVASGEATINDTSVQWASDTVGLDSASTQPRVDVIEVREDASLHAITGAPNAYRPNTDEDGNTITPAPFQHWEPAPDDGTNVLGMPLACVLVEPTMADSTDLTTDHIQDRRLDGADNSSLVKGNGEDNGRTVIVANDADTIFQDETDDVQNWLHREYSTGLLHIGGPNAMPMLRTNLNLQKHQLKDYAMDVRSGRQSSPVKGQRIYNDGLAKDALETWTGNNWSREYPGQQWGTVSWTDTRFDAGEENDQLVATQGDGEIRVVSVEARSPVGLTVGNIEVKFTDGPQDNVELSWKAANNSGKQFNEIDNPIVTLTNPNNRMILKNTGSSAQRLSAQIRYVYV